MKQLEERLAKVPLPPLSPGQTKRFTDAVFPQEGGSDSGNKIVSHRTWLARAAIWTVLVSLTSALAWYATRDIWQSAREGDIEAVKQHLASGTDVNARGEDREFMKLMLANGIDVKYLGDISTETTPLYQAAFNGHKELVELLLEKGADIAYSDPNVPGLTINGRHFESFDFSYNGLVSFDAVIILVNHAAWNVRQIVEGSTLLIDARNATGPTGEWNHVVKL